MRYVESRVPVIPEKAKLECSSCRHTAKADTLGVDDQLSLTKGGYEWLDYVTVCTLYQETYGNDIGPADVIGECSACNHWDLKQVDKET